MKKLSLKITYILLSIFIFILELVLNFKLWHFDNFEWKKIWGFICSKESIMFFAANGMLLFALCMYYKSYKPEEKEYDKGTYICFIGFTFFFLLYSLIEFGLSSISTLFATLSLMIVGGVLFRK